MKSLPSLVATAAFVAVLPVNSLAPADVATSRIRRTPNLSPCTAAATTHFEATMEDTLERKSSSPNNNNDNNSNANHNISKANYLSPFLQEMIDEQRQLQMNVGKAMDALRKDYPYFLKRSLGECLDLSRRRGEVIVAFFCIVITAHRTLFLSILCRLLHLS